MGYAGGRSSGILILMSVIVGGCATAKSPSLRSDRVISDGWRFVRRDVGGGGQGMGLDDSRWQRVSLPHTWNARDGQDGGDDYYRGGAWYRRKLRISSGDAGKNFFLRFEGAATVCDAYVNGRHAGQHRGNFGAFCFDITDLVKAGGENVIAVRVDNSKFDDVPPLSGDFTIFGGLYRDVHLLALGPLGITPLDDASSGVYLKPTTHDESSATVRVIAKLRNGGANDKTATVVCDVRDADGRIIASQTIDQPVAAKSSADAIAEVAIGQPHYWDGVRDPYLYQVDIAVKDGPMVVDAVSQPLGLRYFDIDAKNGFILNGKRYPLHGVNKHQDRIDTGWAISRRDLDEDYRLIREMGVTGIRLAHYQHSNDEYSLCDKLGIVVWAELAYVNLTGAMPAFGDNASQQLRELIKQNYNHPSICFWSLYNELSFGKDQAEQRPEQMELIVKLNALAHELDPSRPTVCATNLRPTHAANWITDLTAFNRYHGWYSDTPWTWSKALDELHFSFAGKSIGISEYGAGASIVQHQNNAVTRPDTRGRWHPEEWQCIVHEAAWKAMKERPWLWGTFAWNMFDFASDHRSEGDSLGRNDKGLVTYDRKVRKDAFYFYKCNWTSEPVVHITSRRFDPRPSGPTLVKIYSNCDSVELIIDGKSLNVRGDGENCVFTWTTNLRPGRHKVTAVGIKDGKEYRDRLTWDVSAAAAATTR